MATFEENVKWMPASNKLYFTQKASDSSIAGEEKQDGTLQLITINPLTMEREVLASNLPEGWFQFTPDEKRSSIRSLLKAEKRIRKFMM